MALADNALTTPKIIRNELGITGDVDRLINVASDRIERFCSRSFYYEAARVDSVGGFRSFYLTVEKAPILSVASITYDGATIDSAEYEIDDDWHIRGDSGFLWTTGVDGSPSQEPIPGSEKKLYEVTYACGYVTPSKEKGLGLDRTLPYDLEDACVQLVVQRYQNIGREVGIASEKLLSHQVTYDKESIQGMPPAVSDLLMPYKRIAQA